MLKIGEREFQDIWFSSKYFNWRFRDNIIWWFYFCLLHRENRKKIWWETLIQFLLLECSGFIWPHSFFPKNNKKSNRVWALYFNIDNFLEKVEKKEFQFGKLWKEKNFPPIYVRSDFKALFLIDFLLFFGKKRILKKKNSSIYMLWRSTLLSFLSRKCQ